MEAYRSFCLRSARILKPGTYGRVTSLRKLAALRSGLAFDGLVQADYSSAAEREGARSARSGLKRDVPWEP